jgi:predicted amidohydrolase YtcJ
MIPADLILTNGVVLTLNFQDTESEAIAVKDGKILSVGSNEEISKLSGPQTKVIDLKGRTATPGFISTHDHFLQHGISAEFILDIRYPKTRSCKEIAEAISERAAETEKGKWIIATGWDETLLEERRFPNRWDIDPASPDNPVWIRRVFEMGVANTRALDEAEITKDTPDPPLGRIDRDEGGEPTGLLKGRAMDMIVSTIPPWTQEEMEQGIKRACADFLAHGMTAVIEPGILMPQLEAYRSLHGKRGLTVRTFIQYGFLHDQGEVEEAISKVQIGGDDNLRVIGLKYAVDGGVGPRTAMMHEPFEGQPENRGTQLIDSETLKEMTLMGHEAGFQVAIHAIGDRGIDSAIDAYEHAQKTSPRPDPRHQIVHCYFPSEEALSKIKALGVMVNTQAPFLYWLGDSFIEAVGRERAARCIPLRTMLDQGIPVGNSHDSTVTPPLPTIGIYASVARKTIKGDAIGEYEAITPLQALRTYTTLAARHAFMEQKIGSLEPGKYADIAVWNRNPLEADTEEIKELEVEMTLVEGQVRYARNDL